jgi:hypothetical protein
MNGFSFSGKEWGFPGDSGGVRFGVLFDIEGRILSLHVSSNGTGGRGDPLFDKVMLVLSLARLVKGLIVGLTKAGLKILMRRASRELDDAILFTSATAGRMSEAYGIKIGEELFRKSKWLRELRRIKGIQDEAKRYEAIAKFIDDYKRATGVTINVVPRHLAEKRGLDLTRRNYGTYAEKQKTIYMHEDTWTRTGVDTVGEIAHEVGAAEIGRILSIAKDFIPKVAVETVLKPLTKRQYVYLTHIIDVLL